MKYLRQLGLGLPQFNLHTAALLPLSLQVTFSLRGLAAGNIQCGRRCCLQSQAQLISVNNEVS